MPDPKIKAFCENIETLINLAKSSVNCDEELLHLLTLKCLTEKCLTGSSQNVDKDSLMTYLDTIKFKEKPKDMILAVINIANDNLLEAVFLGSLQKREKIDINQFSRDRSNKKIFERFLHLVKNYLTQCDIIKAICVNNVSVASTPMEILNKEKTDVLQDIIYSTIDYMALDYPNSFGNSFKSFSFPSSNSMSAKQNAFNNTSFLTPQSFEQPYNKFLDNYSSQQPTYDNLIGGDHI